MISPILALAFVAATTLAMPSPPTETKTSTTRELVASVYGPLSSWEPIRLIDAFPDALVDGKPVNSSVVLGYRAPALATAEQRNRAQELLFSREGGIQKRAEFGCYRAGHYICMLPPSCANPSRFYHSASLSLSYSPPLPLRFPFPFFSFLIFVPYFVSELYD